MCLAIGCGNGDSDEDEQNAVRSVDLTVIVVDDPAISEAIRQRWELEGDEDSTLTVTDVVSGEFFDDESSWTGDVLIYPSRDMGELTSRGWIEPILNKDLDSENLSWKSVFSLLRLRECNWGSQAYGLTFGSPVPVLFYRHDLFAAAELEPPRTWEEYAALVEHFRARPESIPEPTNGSWNATIEPLNGPNAAHMLMARAAGYASHRGTLSVLFDTRTMQPRIDGEPFQRAALELRDATTPGTRDLTAEEALAAILHGRCAMAISYLSTIESAEIEAWDRLSMAPLPGAHETYDRRLGKWEPQSEPNAVVLLATRGRIGSVAKRTKSKVAAVRLLIRLSGISWGDEVAPKSSQTTAYRPAQIGETALWGPDGVPEGIVEQYLNLQSQELSGQGNVVVPRLRGGRQLDAALATAVAEILRDEKPIKDALSDAAAVWKVILAKELGDKAQREYVMSEGL